MLSHWLSLLLCIFAVDWILFKQTPDVVKNNITKWPVSGTHFRPQNHLHRNTGCMRHANQHRLLWGSFLWVNRKVTRSKVFDRQTQTDEQKTNQKQYALVYRHWGKWRTQQILCFICKMRAYIHMSLGERTAKFVHICLAIYTSCLLVSSN